ncbi:folylpolyglutamate synthase, mitochondrial-like [Halichondria panicea]|uniref:folylpolyglutamate synthase, mitochondrial-like n=1 Tax=Halichondria panicea TaxID=6063 RepID=UPI00312B43CD
MFCTRSRLLKKVTVLARAYARSRISRKLAMCSGERDKQYNEAVETLNGLQTNASVLEKVSKSATGQRRSRELHEVVTFLKRIGLETSNLDQLNAIHVTGTKGKGSVCAMSERILRAYGLKTGFYSSPHLREVRERIRLNGRPLSKPQFVENFWEVYNKLSSSKEDYGGVMPPYFRFLTVMAFNVFLKEKVDVAVIEVGIGGTFDTTNVIPNPVVCGIASLGLDHVELLGDTLEKIAWQKGGICKRGHPAFTMPQDPGPLGVLQERAKELEALPLEVAPELGEYPGEEPVLALAGEHQKMNASLAAQLCRSWLQIKGMWSDLGQDAQAEKRHLHGVPVAQPFPLTPQFYEGLREVRWPGRNQIIKRERVTYYVDGAHTPKSIETSAEWFMEVSAKEAEALTESTVRVLIFNITGKRINRTDVFLRPLVDCGFDYALFAPNIADVDGAHSADQTNLTVTKDTMLDCVRMNESTWRKLATEQCVKNGQSHNLDDNTYHNDHVATSDQLKTRVFASLREAVNWCTVDCHGEYYPQNLKDSSIHVQVLVTGSLHLAGAFMSVLDINVDES